MAEVVGQSKNAKRRAAKKANAAAAAAKEAEPVQAQPKAKPEGKAKAAPATTAPVPQPKAAAKGQPQPKAKGKAQAAPVIQPVAPVVPEVAPEETVAPKKKKTKKPKQPTEEAPLKPKDELPSNAFVDDDGAGGEWEQDTRAANKKKKNMEKKEAAAKEAAAKVKATPVAAAPVQQVQVQTNWAKNRADERERQDKEVADAVAKALAKADAIINATVTKKAVAKDESGAALKTTSVDVPDAKVGVVIGPKGANLALIKEKTGVSRIDTQGTGTIAGNSSFTISGEDEDSINAAAHAIKELIEKGVMSIAFENFGEKQVMVHPSSVPDLIGKQGIIIRKIKEELNVEVAMPTVPEAKGYPGPKKYPVKLAGDAANVDKAEEVVNSICKYYCHPITHPDQTYIEIDVPEHQRRFIIGRAGSEMRHIQNCFKVKVFIPREHSENSNVVVVGDAELVPKAKEYIERTIAAAEGAAKKTGDKEEKSSKPSAADDGMGENAAEDEPWMNQYVKKRVN